MNRHLFSGFLVICLVVELLGQTVTLCLTFCGIIKLFSTEAAWFYIPHLDVWGFQFIHIFTDTYYCLFMIAIFTSMKWLSCCDLHLPNDSQSLVCSKSCHFFPQNSLNDFIPYEPRSLLTFLFFFFFTPYLSWSSLSLISCYSPSLFPVTGHKIDNFLFTLQILPLDYVLLEGKYHTYI